MTVAVLPGAYCRCDVSPGSVCPGCGSRTPIVGDGEPLPMLLAGCRRASSGARIAASVVDAGLVLALAAVPAVAGAGAAVIGLAIALLVVALPFVALSYLNDGRTPGRLLLGLRTVDALTGVPLRRLTAVVGRKAAPVTLDVRSGRDPVRPVVPRVVPPRPVAAPPVEDVPVDVTGLLPPEPAGDQPMLIRRSNTSVALSDVVPGATPSPAPSGPAAPYAEQPYAAAYADDPYADAQYEHAPYEDPYSDLHSALPGTVLQDAPDLDAPIPNGADLAAAGYHDAAATMVGPAVGYEPGTYSGIGPDPRMATQAVLRRIPRLQAVPKLPQRAAIPPVGTDTAIIAMPSILTRRGGVAPAGEGAVHVILDDGVEFQLSGSALIGRQPQPAPGEDIEILVQLHDVARSVSKTHLGLHWDGRQLWVEDRHSANGTTVLDPGGTWQSLQAGRPYPVSPGTRIQLGGRRLVVGTPPERQSRDGVDA